jgi:hypothetical protein
MVESESVINVEMTADLVVEPCWLQPIVRVKCKLVVLGRMYEAPGPKLHI